MHSATMSFPFTIANAITYKIAHAITYTICLPIITSPKKRFAPSSTLLIY
jgi:hypothetical protein